MLSDDLDPARIAETAQPKPTEGRFQRVKVSILGRYMLADRREFPCQVIEMSPGDATLIAPVSGIDGERIIAYLDQIGRVKGLSSIRLKAGS